MVSSNIVNSLYLQQTTIRLEVKGVGIIAFIGAYNVTILLYTHKRLKMFDSSMYRTKVKASIDNNFIVEDDEG
jgi:hypothetical protein